MKWSNGGDGTKKHYIIEGPYRTHQWRVGLSSEFQEADRLWRKQYLKDQVLAPKDLHNDMDRLPEFRKARYNLIRRVARMPGDALEGAFRGFMSSQVALLSRLMITRGLFVWALGVGVAFYVTTQESDWTRFQGMRILDRTHAIYPGHPEWPHNTSQKREKPSDFGNRGFEHSTI
ncbi:hypothetical protein TCAL_13329 [Tigriopus californicus]|uniref:Uncharacterized protein n=2 Tax=Tigriopus californicus TaxID=6832 RepID=A0A553NUX0_TIGCA|nr:hypothetical protein TCAL_13329 [Tigriopus californicus]|eukprot:TCALIF_13329-PA protein Name:"Protein of unknown function" AED:0.03 eAED:0.04 QI:0/-1/0/1/-1/1/1/0/174